MNLEKSIPMQISIQADDLLFNIQNRFQEMYPYLKLDFLTTSTADSGFAGEAKSIDVRPERSVAQLEEELKGICGVNVRVLRKCGQRKHEPVSGQGTTLAQQNKQGKLRTVLAPVPDVY
ncbi:hypothetical protein DCC81_23120 [Chitinophaga parva]|uniref:Uncharacterized protein n=2 Tax=Chitinophaga parva TaxID=2169414 RepID=A0A2T7BDY4_9BACT|nr:hypothetical protein DCC81_23120 [Chitinophaga parva]